MTVKEFGIKMADGSSLGSQIEKWAEQDLGDMQYLSAGLTNLVQNALQDGIIDVDEQAAIDELQTKINNIMQGWQEAEAQAEMDVLTQKYGRLSGKDLTDDTFTKVVEEVGKQRETATAALEESEKKLYTTLNALNRPDANGVQRISDSELANYKEQAGYAARNNEAAMLGNSVQFETNTLSDAYGEKLQENYSAIQTNTDNFLKNANTYLQNQDYGALADSLAWGFNASMQSANLYEEIMGSDQAAMQDIYKAMKPDVDSMTGLIDEYREMGQAIPQDVMQAFNDAMMVGAAAGDADAAWQVFASQMVADPANAALVTIKAGTIDSAGLSGEITSQLGEQPAVPVTVPANVTVTAGTIDHTQALASTQEDVLAAFAVPFPTPGTVDVTLAKGTDNIAALYAEIGGLVRSAWAAPYSASGTVNVTLTANYSLANPTKTISFGGGATGSATVSASLHALGGIFDEPHLGIVAEAGPESIIPLDGSDRSLSLFEQTGEMLGVWKNDDGNNIAAPTQTVNAPQSLSQPAGSPQISERVIRLEIGGKGSINVSGSGVSKEKIVDAMMENLRDVFMNIVQQEIIEEGEGAYEF